MRFQYGRLIPYLCIVVLLFLSQGIQEKVALGLHESKLKMRSWFSKKPCTVREQNASLVSVQRIETSHADTCFFHEILDSFSPWISAEIVSHKESPWSHTAWIDIGSTTSDLLFPIAPNCPVVYGNHVVGIVEQVGEKASLIRLLSDTLLRPSVQVLRGGVDQELETIVLRLQQKLETSPFLLAKESHRMALSKLLSELRSTLPVEEQLWLAKGELQGALSVQNPTVLRGVGFNYDIADERGPSRDIRTGQVDGAGPKLPLIQPGDLLVTNGFDGLYPPGLKVAFVQKVLPMEEGGYAYEVEAKASCPNFFGLHYVAILPPVPQEVHQGSPDLSILLRQVEREVETEI